MIPRGLINYIVVFILWTLESQSMALTCGFLPFVKKQTPFLQFGFRAGGSRSKRQAYTYFDV